MAGRTVAGRYDLEHLLGGGAMSAVWLAHDRELDRMVAVKLLAPHADRQRFEREARAVAALGHPNVAQLYDYGESDAQPYMVLEHLPGGTLEDRLVAGAPLADAETERIAHEVAAGLAHAHAHGVVHRDLKPANILFDGEGRAKIADFGIARVAGGGTLTEAGTVLGTAATISPEQASGEPATPASDVYSFGAILYRMLTGRGPFASDHAMELVRMHREEEPAPVEGVRADAPAALAALALAALAKDPRERPADGSALVAALGGTAEPETDLATAPVAVAAGDTSARTQVLATGAPRRRGGVLLPLLAGGAALVALGGVAAAFLLTGRGSSGNGPGPGDVNLPALLARSTGSTATTGSATLPTTGGTGTRSTTGTGETTTRETSTGTSTTSGRTTTGSTAVTLTFTGLPTSPATATTTSPTAPATTAAGTTAPATTSTARGTTTASTTSAPAPTSTVARTTTATTTRRTTTAPTTTATATTTTMATTTTSTTTTAPTTTGATTSTTATTRRRTTSTASTTTTGTATTP